MITRILIATGFAAGLLVSAANAMTVSNLDNTAQRLVFTPKGGHAHYYTLAARHNRNLDCKGGGTLVLGKETHPCDGKTAKIVIKGGAGGDLVIGPAHAVRRQRYPTKRSPTLCRPCRFAARPRRRCSRAS
jgi:hypothetical protein